MENKELILTLDDIKQIVINALRLNGEDILSGGKGDNKKDDDFDLRMLKIGIAVEKEHTNDSYIAKEIAKDHLTEDPMYYIKLIKSGLADEPEAIRLYNKWFGKKFGYIDLDDIEKEEITESKKIIKENLVVINKELDTGENVITVFKPIFFNGKGKWFGYYNDDEKRIYIGYDFKKLKRIINNTLVYEFNNAIQKLNKTDRYLWDSKIRKLKILLNKLKDNEQTWGVSFLANKFEEIFINFDEAKNYFTSVLDYVRGIFFLLRWSNNVELPLGEEFKGKIKCVEGNINEKTGLFEYICTPEKVVNTDFNIVDELILNPIFIKYETVQGFKSQAFVGLKITLIKDNEIVCSRGIPLIIHYDIYSLSDLFKSPKIPQFIKKTLKLKFQNELNTTKEFLTFYNSHLVENQEDKEEEIESILYLVDRELAVDCNLYLYKPLKYNHLEIRENITL